jgi:hypothetical protein
MPDAGEKTFNSEFLAKNVGNMIGFSHGWNTDKTRITDVSQETRNHETRKGMAHKKTEMGAKLSRNGLEAAHEVVL